MTPPVRLGHVSVPVKDPAGAAGFYRSLLGLEVTMTGAVPGLGDFVFLAGSAHSALPVIALHTEPRGRHAALQVDTLDELRTFWAGAVERGLVPFQALNHRVSVSVYFLDPEGNAVEVFWATGVMDNERPYAQPITLDDLSGDETEVLARLGVTA